MLPRIIRGSLNTIRYLSTPCKHYCSAWLIVPDHSIKGDRFICLFARYPLSTKFKGKNKSVPTLIGQGKMEADRKSIDEWAKGFHSGFGVVFVNGNRRLPSPAASNTAVSGYLFSAS